MNSSSSSSTSSLSNSLGRLTAGEIVFDRFTLVRFLGRGGMGVVWLAEDIKLARVVALKFLPELVTSDPANLDELKRETLRSLELTHPHIVRVYDFVGGLRGGAICMEYVDGPTLAELRIQRPEKVLSSAEIAQWIQPLCGALDYAHREALLVHRDLKPSNLMLTSEGKIKIADFGTARTISDTATRMTQASHGGTLIYMSPQQLEGAPPGVADDIYSLGATLYELLTGKPPFHSGDIRWQILTKMPPPIRGRKDQTLGVGLIPSEWEETLLACLAKDPGLRPASASEVAKRLCSSRTLEDSTRLLPHLQIDTRLYGAPSERNPTASNSKFPLLHALMLFAGLALLAAVWFVWKALVPGPKARIFEVSQYGATSNGPSPLHLDALTNSASNVQAYLDRAGLVGKVTQDPRGIFRFDITYRSGVTDVTPLAWIPFGELNLRENPITDLGPLRGMPLITLALDQTAVTNLSPLQGSPIRSLFISGTPLGDIGPLRGTPLDSLNISNTKVTDLRPLSGMPLRFLDMNDTRVTDFTPLSGLPLQVLHMGRTTVTNLDFLRGMALRTLGLSRTPMRDLSPLRELPFLSELYLHECPDGLDLAPLIECRQLEKLTIPQHPRSLGALRALPKLKFLNTEHDGGRQTVTEFWVKHDKQSAE